MGYCVLVWPPKSEEPHDPAHFPAPEPFTRAREGEARELVWDFSQQSTRRRNSSACEPGLGHCGLYILLTRGDIDPGLCSAHITDRYHGIKGSSYQHSRLWYYQGNAWTTKDNKSKSHSLLLGSCTLTFNTLSRLRRGCILMHHNIEPICIRNISCFVTHSVTAHYLWSLSSPLWPSAWSPV